MSAGSVRVALASAIGLLAVCGAAELVARTLGERPWPVDSAASVPVTVDADPVLGWRSRPGVHELPVASQRIQMTILEDASRATGRLAPSGGAGADGAPASPSQQWWMLGGSAVLGWGLDDEATLPSRLQAELPDVRVRNFGTVDYGTFQSLLTLERMLDSEPAPARVVYGFTERHEERNVATPQWLQQLARRTLAVPYVTLGRRGVLVRHEPTRYPAWPLRRQLALVDVGQRLAMQWRVGNRAEERRAVTRRLTVAMDRLCRQRDIELLVALLWAPNVESFYLRGLREAGVHAVDCTLDLGPDPAVPADGSATAHWSRCILGAAAASGERP